MPNQVDAVDELLKLVPHLQHQLCQPNCPRYQARAKLNALLVAAHVDEITRLVQFDFPKGEAWETARNWFVADRIKELEKQRGITE